MAKRQTPNIRWTVDVPSRLRDETKQEASFWAQQSARIAYEKKSQQALRNQLIEQKLNMNEAVLGKLEGATKPKFDSNTNEVLTSLVDQYVDIKNGMLKSQGEPGYISSQEGMRALNMIKEQTNDIAFFNNQLSSDILPHLRTMIGKDASLGYKDSKGAMSTAVPTGSQRLMMAIDNNENVTWKFNDEGQLLLVMPAGTDKEGNSWEEEEFNLNEYGKYIEKGEEFFFEIPDIDDELNGAAQFVVGTPDKPKLSKNAKSYYTYDTTADGKIKYETISMTDENREQAIQDLMAADQFNHLLYNENRLNDRKALWQDCVGDVAKDEMMLFEEGFDPGTGQNTAWNGSDEQLEILHRWLAETAIEQNLAPGTHVTAMSRESSDGGSGSSGVSSLTKTQQRNVDRNKPQYKTNMKLVDEIKSLSPSEKEIETQTGKSRDNKRQRLLIKELNKGEDPVEGGEFVLGKTIETLDESGNKMFKPLDIVYVDVNGIPKKIDVDINDSEAVFDFLNDRLIGDETVIYNLGQENITLEDKSEINENIDIDAAKEFAKSVGKRHGIPITEEEIQLALIMEADYDGGNRVMENSQKGVEEFIRWKYLNSKDGYNEWLKKARKKRDSKTTNVGKSGYARK